MPKLPCPICGKNYYDVNACEHDAPDYIEVINQLNAKIASLEENINTLVALNNQMNQAIDQDNKVAAMMEKFLAELEQQTQELFTTLQTKETK